MNVQRSHLGRIRTVVSATFLLAVAGSLTLLVTRERAEIGRALDQVSLAAFALATAAAVVGVLALYRAWRVSLVDAGIDIRPPQSFAIYAIGQAGKYLPGAVWPVLTQAELARRRGWSGTTMATGSLVALLVSVVTATALGCALLPFSGAGTVRTLWYVPLLALFGVALLAPAVMNRCIALVNQIPGVRTPAPRFSMSATLRCAGWVVVGNLWFGTHLFLIGHALGIEGVDGWLRCVAAYSLASAAGVVVVIAPAGAGVREVVLALILAPDITWEFAIVAALLSRMALVLADVLLLTVAWPGLRRTSAPGPVFVTRKFPPSVGGMETLAAGTWQALTVIEPGATLVAHGGPNRSLIWWFPKAIITTALLVLRGRADRIITGDALTYAVLRPVAALTAVPIITMAMGLDVTYENRLYRRVVHPALRRARRIIAISDATRDAVVATGVAPDRVQVVRLGVPVPDIGPDDRRTSRNQVAASLDLPPGAWQLLTLGRLVPRKGVAWFVSEVLPHLPTTVHHIVAGEGPDRAHIAASARSAGVADRVHLLGRVDDARRELLMCGADVFVQPNIEVPGDMEGFGLVAIEAGVRGTPVLAASLEGLRDAVVDGRTGTLLPSGDAAAWIHALDQLLTAHDDVHELGWSRRAETVTLYGESAMQVALGRALS